MIFIRGSVKPYLEILKVVWPLALGMINNAVMQFADRAYLAHDSLFALEAVLPAGVLAWIFMCFFQSVVGYSGVFVAQYHGAKNPTACLHCHGAAVLIAVVSGLLTLPLLGVGHGVLALSAPSDTVLELERVYYDIVLLGGIFVYWQMAAASYFTGRGETRIVFFVNLLGNVLNVILDPFLIFGWWGCPQWGIKGAAVATVFSMGVQALALELAIPRAPFAWARLREEGRLIRSILRFGVPAGLYEFLNMLSFAIFVFVTGGVGHLEFAVSNACFTINYLLFAPMTGFALGAQTLVGQARGRGDDAGAVTVFRRTLFLALLFVALAGALTLIFHRPILSLFAPTLETAAKEFYSLGFVLLLLMAAWMVFDAADVVVSGALKGAGDTTFVMGWMLFCAFGLWLPAVFVVRAFHRTMPALWGTMIGFVFVICCGTFRRWSCGAWRRHKLV